MIERKLHNYRITGIRKTGGLGERFSLKIWLSCAVKKRRGGRGEDKQSSCSSKVSPSPGQMHLLAWLGHTGLVPPAWNQSQGSPGHSPKPAVWLRDSCNRHSAPPTLGSPGAQWPMVVPGRMRTGPFFSMSMLCPLIFLWLHSFSL